jgi:hypothetical protein
MPAHLELAEPADGTPAGVTAPVRAAALVDRTGEIHDGIMRSPGPAVDCEGRGGPAIDCARPTE